MTAHYVYRISDESGCFYVGVRSCHCQPADDCGYLGSGRWPRHRTYEGARLQKEILAEFDNRQLAEEAEALLIDMVALEKGCQNSLKTTSASFKREHRHLYHRHFGWRKAAVG